MSAPHSQLPTVYRPSVCVIVQGAKQVLLADVRSAFSSGHALRIAVARVSGIWNSPTSLPSEV